MYAQFDKNDTPWNHPEKRQDSPTQDSKWDELFHAPGHSEAQASSAVFSWHSARNIFNFWPLSLPWLFRHTLLKILKAHWMKSFKIFPPNELTITIRCTRSHYHALTNLPTVVLGMCFVLNWHHIIICFHLLKYCHMSKYAGFKISKTQCILLVGQ